MKTNITITTINDDDAGNSTSSLTMHLVPETKTFTLDASGLFEEQEFDIEEFNTALQILRGIQNV